MVQKFIQKANIKKGSLRKQLGYSGDRKIPEKTLKRIVDTPIGSHVKVNGETHTVTTLLKRRASFAYNIRR